MVCPVCGFEYVHLEEVVLKKSDDYTAWEGRGDALRIPVWCENGHRWILRFGFHKGTVHFMIESDPRGGNYYDKQT